MPLLGWRGRTTLTRGTRGRIGRAASDPADRRRPHPARLERGRRADCARRRRRPPAATISCLVVPPSPTAATPALGGHAEPPRARAGPGSCSRRPASSTSGAAWFTRSRASQGSASRWRTAPRAPRGGCGATRWTCSSPRRRPHSPSSGARALRADALAAVLLAWPEAWEEEESGRPLMQDLDKETQRSCSPRRRTGRRAWWSATPGGRSPWATSALEGAPSGPVRTVSVPWGRRVAGLAELVELLDPDVAGDLDGGPGAPRGDRGRPRRCASPRAAVVTGDAPEARRAIIAFDLPDARSGCGSSLSAGRGRAAGASGHRALRRAASPRPAGRSALPGRARRGHDGGGRAARRDRARARDRARRTARCSPWRRCSSGTIRPPWRPRSTSCGPAPPARPRRPRCRTFRRRPGCTSASARRTAPRSTIWWRC